MADYRSKSFTSDGKIQAEHYDGTKPGDFRSYSASSVRPPPPDFKLKSGKTSGGSSSCSWNFIDSEFQMKKRLARYKVYSVEGKVKGTLRKSFKWIKDKYTQVLYGWS